MPLQDVLQVGVIVPLATRDLYACGGIELTSEITLRRCIWKFTMTRRGMSFYMIGYPRDRCGVRFVRTLYLPKVQRDAL